MARVAPNGGIAGAADVFLPDRSATTMVGTVLSKSGDGFGGLALDTTIWDIETNVGGMTMGVTGSILTVGMGTTANAELRLLMKEVVSIPVDIYVALSLSQRIVNQDFYIELVEVDPTTFLPVVNPNLAGDWQNRIGAHYTGVTNTTAIYEAVGFASNAVKQLTAAAQIASTPVFDLTMELRAQDAIFYTGAADTLTAKNAAAARLSSENVDPNKPYRLRLRFKNGAVAPASNTNVLLNHILVSDVQELTAEVTSGRGDTSPGKGIAVNVVGNTAPAQALAAGAALIGTIGVSVTASGVGATTSRILAAATDNPVLVKTGASKLFGLSVGNDTAAKKYLRLYNKATAPTSADTPVATFIIPASGNLDFDGMDFGAAFPLGLGYRITGAAGDADATATAVGDVTGILLYN